MQDLEAFPMKITPKLPPKHSIALVKICGAYIHLKIPTQAIENAQGIFTGGGNTFLLVQQLHDNKLLAPIRKAIIDGAPYLGTSAGSNICGITMQNTNDMPIVYPPSFNTLGVIPFNINAHYMDPDPKTTHMGESRATRIKEYHTQNTTAVVGLPAG